VLPLPWGLASWHAARAGCKPRPPPSPSAVGVGDFAGPAGQVVSAACDGRNHRPNRAQSIHIPQQLPPFLYQEHFKRGQKVVAVDWLKSAGKSVQR
jgi:hypothetical protein